MTDLILVLLAAIGLGHILVDGKIAEPLRNGFATWQPRWLFGILNDIITCHQCCSTWTGFFCGLVMYGWSWQHVLLCGLASSFLSMFAALAMNFMEARTIVSLNEQDEEKDRIE